MCLFTYGATYLNYEEDLRAGYSFQSEDISGEINSIGGSVRQVFSDKKGDRWILYLQAEAENNFSEIMAHQLYGRFKGPMGKWNVSLGRVPLPLGLLTGWSPERMPYSSPYKSTGLLKADNGFLVNGTVGIIDYGVSLTQGFGMGEIESFPGPGLVTARVGISPLIGGELLFGISGSGGTSYRSMGHGEHSMAVEHISAALDGTAYLGRAIIRFELGIEAIESTWSKRGFLESEFQLLPKLTLHGAGNLFMKNDELNGTAFAGVSTKLKSVTIRGGYEYEYQHETKQTVTVQLYRQFSYNR